MRKGFKGIIKQLPDILLSAAVSFLLVLIAFITLPNEREGRVVNCDEILRLRVVANSDSAFDKEQKLAVRDGVMPVVEELVRNCKSKKEAKSALLLGADLLEKKASDILRSRGDNKDVAVRSVKELAPAKRYNGFVLSAGEYDTIRIDIGEAKGKNWWCVLFPLYFNTNDDGCSLAFASDERTVYDLVSKEQKNNKKEYRFAVFDWLF